jgi:hypothetical protein
MGCPIGKQILKGRNIPWSGFVNRVIATNNDIFQVSQTDPKAEGLPRHGGQGESSIAWTLHSRERKVDAKSARGGAHLNPTVSLAYKRLSPSTFFQGKKAAVS